MDYREAPPPPALEGLVKARWTLAGAGTARDWIGHHATPDGCIEIIRRLTGRSRWGGEQPLSFAVGLIERPELFEISGDSSFGGLRLWPWAWPLLSTIPHGAARGRWLPFDAPGFAAIEARLASEQALAATGRAIVAAESVAEMGAATGMNPRALQRWFARRVGLPPRRYLRLLRFRAPSRPLPASPPSPATPPRLVSPTRRIWRASFAPSPEPPRAPRATRRAGPSFPSAAAGSGRRSGPSGRGSPG